MYRGEKRKIIENLGLTKFGRDTISVYNFDTKENEVIRDIYIDERDNEYAYLWGEFYLIDRDKTTYRYHIVD